MLVQIQAKNLSVFLLLLFLTIAPVSPSYLDTQGQTILKVDDFLISPLGNYRLKLLSNCSLQLQLFNQKNDQYEKQDIVNFSQQSSKVCSSITLSLNNKGILNNDGIPIYRLPNQQFTRIIMEVNDAGDVKIIYFQMGQVGESEAPFFKTQLRIASRQSRFLYDLLKYTKYQNRNGWNFENTNGLMVVSKQNKDINISKIFNITGSIFTQSGFVDPYGEIRYSSIPGLTFNPRAGNSFCRKPPESVFAQFDEYWPLIRVYDRDKYLLAQYKIDEMKSGIYPEKTFLLKDKCLTSCPQPYFKQIRGNIGYCSLKCETNSQIDMNKKVCTSTNYQNYTDHNLNIILNRKCPSQSQQYEFGCKCLDNKFYDINTNSCNDKCGENQFGVQGICAKCPQRCQNCEMDSQKIAYLSCKNCSQSFMGKRCIQQTTMCQNIQNCAKCKKDIDQTEICQKCSSFYFLNINKKSCSANCGPNQISIIGSSGEGYCNGVQFNQVAENFIGGQYKDKSYILKKQGTCQFGTKIFREKCVRNCPSGYQENRNGRCICQSQHATFWNETCIKITEIQKNQIGYYYNATYNTFFNCPVGCISCQFNYCFKCAPNYILVVTPLSSICRQNSLYFSCKSDYYTYDAVNKICISNNLRRPFTNLTNCQLQLKGKCIACKTNFYLSEGACRSSCQKGYTSSNGRCIKQLDNCLISTLKSVPQLTIVSPNILANSAYKLYSLNQTQISNQPITQILAIRNQLGIQTNQKLNTHIYRPQIVCQFVGNTPQNSSNQNITIPTNPNQVPIVPVPTPTIISDICDQVRPYQLTDGTCVQNCPVNTFPFQVKNQKKLMCLPQSRCYLLNKSTPFQLQNGSCVSGCPQFSSRVSFGRGLIITCQTLTDCQKKSMITPFKLANNQCSSSCPPGTFPRLEQQQLKCQTMNSETPKKINIDASVYPLVSSINGVQQNIFYFVVDQIFNSDDIFVNYYGYQTRDSLRPMVSQSKGLKNRMIDSTVFNNKTYIAIKTTADEVVLDLSKNIKQFYSSNGNRLSSSFYGVKLTENRIHNTRSWLAIIAYVLSLLLICLHAIYIGNQLLYKVDNFLIFAQSMFYFSFVHLLINTSIGQFYYGFLWSHFGFYPNYFGGTIPPEYMQGYLNEQNQFLPNSYRLLTGDANFIRNAGFSFSLIITFLAAFLVVCVAIFLMKKICGKYEIWYKRIAKQALLGAFQFVSFNIFYWAVSHLLMNRNFLFRPYPNQPQIHVNFRNSCSAASIAWICIYGLYMIVRFVFNKIAGVYMFKRLAFATILASSAYHSNGEHIYKLFLIPLVAAQLIFMGLRFVFEQTYLKRQKIFILLQSLLVIIAYVTIYLWNDTGFVSIFVSLVLFLFIFLFTADLMDVYLDNKDQFYQDQVKLAPGLRHKQSFINLTSQHENTNHISLPQTDRKFKE